ncbi:conjugal transfer protein [Tetragenococcus koreensis]|uniref:Transposase n=1 Tax=Tetragenococcus koreensis TaxID=290335 RepID=A0AAN4UC10_9ENTE|nr:conjugal transfer protein [Tetragenococcus koreensis]GEQ49658.1 transposase [Tetragenococcus koreensis]GEQ52104.1 transposase [Tetragenococcus koreensis]GEQ54639.1 transposase [Tetragenococcus koreensis]GEQ57081.1 transposase [Tetragenococcus koreensis]GEQ59671.1 transposase [Tetragenococcus koreensis]
MKIKIEREPKQKKAKKQKAPKVTHIGTRKKGVMALWILLACSLLFAIYKNFTGIDQHTVHEQKVIEETTQDTKGIESFVYNFIQNYYSWENDSEALDKRQVELQNYLTDELQELNSDTVRSDIPTSSEVKRVQIWRVQPEAKRTFSVIYTVDQEVSEDDDKETLSNTYRLTLYQAQTGNFVIVKNPVPWTAPQKASFEPKQLKESQGVSAKTQEELLEFLETFFKLYPQATQEELDYYVNDQVLPAIDKDYQFSEITQPVFQKDGKQIKAQLVVHYLDEESKSTVVAQYNLVLQKGENWKIVAIGEN